jgi:hypothetical protein
MSAATTYVGVREVRRLREIDGEIEEALSRNAPQALLRDLHRPSKSFTINPDGIERYDAPKDAGRNAYGAIKARIFASYRVPIVELIQTNRMASEALRAMRAILRLPWADAPRTGGRATPFALG